jgi:hypothetical protein
MDRISRQRVQRIIEFLTEVLEEPTLSNRDRSKLLGAKSLLYNSLEYQHDGREDDSDVGERYYSWDFEQSPLVNNPRKKKLSMKKRGQLLRQSRSNFVFPDRAPGVGSYPINDLYHAKLALNMASWSAKGRSDMPEILYAVLKKYPSVKKWDKIDRYYDIAHEEMESRPQQRIAANPRRRRRRR